MGAISAETTIKSSQKKETAHRQLLGQWWLLLDAKVPRGRAPGDKAMRRWLLGVGGPWWRGWRPNFFSINREVTTLGGGGGAD